MEDVLGSRRTFVEFVRAAPLAVVATVDPGGAPQAALVSVVALDDGDLLFTTATRARKVANIGAGARVAVVVGCSGPVSLQVEGDAVVLSGADRGAAIAAYLAAEPGSRVREPGYAIVRVRPHWVRRYDVTTGTAVVLEGRPAWGGD